jgi:hypothetical protein
MFVYPQGDEYVNSIDNPQSADLKPRGLAVFGAEMRLAVPSGFLIPDDEGVVGEVLDHMLLLLPIFLELLCVIIRLPLVQPLEEFGVFGFDPLEFSLPELAVEAFVHRPLWALRLRGLVPPRN